MKPAGLSNRKKVAMSADRQEGGQLDDRFHRDRQHQPVLVLGGVGMARAEQHREQASSIATTSEMSLTNGSKLSGAPE